MPDVWVWPDSVREREGVSGMRLDFGDVLSTGLSTGITGVVGETWGVTSRERDQEWMTGLWEDLEDRTGLGEGVSSVVVGDCLGENLASWGLRETGSSWVQRGGKRGPGLAILCRWLTVLEGLWVSEGEVLLHALAKRQFGSRKMMAMGDPCWIGVSGAHARGGLEPTSEVLSLLVLASHGVRDFACALLGDDQGGACVKDPRALAGRVEDWLMGLGSGGGLVDPVPGFSLLAWNGDPLDPVRSVESRHVLFGWSDGGGVRGSGLGDYVSLEQAWGWYGNRFRHSVGQVRELVDPGSWKSKGSWRGCVGAWVTALRVMLRVCLHGVWMTGLREGDRTSATVLGCRQMVRLALECVRWEPWRFREFLLGAVLGGPTMSGSFRGEVLGSLLATKYLMAVRGPGLLGWLWGVHPGDPDAWSRAGCHVRLGDDLFVGYGLSDREAWPDPCPDSWAGKPRREWFASDPDPVLADLGGRSVRLGNAVEWRALWGDPVRFAGLLRGVGRVIPGGSEGKAGDLFLGFVDEDSDRGCWPANMILKSRSERES